MDTNSLSPVTEFELRGVIAVLRRQVRVIIYTFLLIFGMAGVFLISVTPTFTASALIFVDPEQKNILDNGPVLTGSVGADNARVDSEVEILRSDAVALAVIAGEELMTDPEFGPRPGLRERLAQAVGSAHAAPPHREQTVPKTLSRFRNAVSVRRRGLTYLISVAVSSQSPKRAAELSNALSNVYVAQQVQTKITASLSARDALRDHIKAARQTVASYENGFDVFIDQNIAQLVAEPGKEKLAGLHDEMERTRAALREKASVRDTIAFYLEEQDWETLATTLDDQALIRLDTDRRALMEQVDGNLTPDDMRAALTDLETMLERKSTAGFQALGDDIRALDREAIALRRQIRAALLETELSPEMLTEIYALQQESSIARTQYQTLLSRMRALETQAHIQIADSRIVSPALTLAVPTFPNQRLVLLAALALSAGLGVSLAFLNEYYIGGVTSATQLSELLQLPTAATVPLSNEQNSGRLSVAEKVIDAPLSVYSESIRKIRAAVDRLAVHRYGDPAADKVKGEAFGECLEPAMRRRNAACAHNV